MPMAAHLVSSLQPHVSSLQPHVFSLHPCVSSAAEQIVLAAQTRLLVAYHGSGVGTPHVCMCGYRGEAYRGEGHSLY